MKVRRYFESLMMWVVGIVIVTGLWQMVGRWMFAGGANAA
jgi:hypothetical protein